MRIDVAGFGAPGAAHAASEDSYCVGPFVERTALMALSLDAEGDSFLGGGVLAAVADGMGGYQGAALASRTLLTALRDEFYATRDGGRTGTGLAARIRFCIERAQEALRRRLDAEPGFGDAGTTLAGIALQAPDALVVFHVGDSRVLRETAGFVRALTIDHCAVGADVARGRLVPGEAARVAGGLDLTRSCGLLGDGTPDLDAELTWASGDRFLICTDGLHGIGRGLDAPDLRAVLAESRDASAALARSLVRSAVAKDGSDDATVVVVTIRESE